MKKSILSLTGASLLSKFEQKSLTGGGDRIWMLNCKDGTQFCLNPNGVSPQQMVDMCKPHGGYLRQSTELTQG